MLIASRPEQKRSSVSETDVYESFENYSCNAFHWSNFSRYRNVCKQYLWRSWSATNRPKKHRGWRQKRLFFLLNHNLNRIYLYFHMSRIWLKFITIISFSSSNIQFHKFWIFFLFTLWVFFPHKSFKSMSQYTQKCQYNSLY